MKSVMTLVAVLMLSNVTLATDATAAGAKQENSSAEAVKTKNKKVAMCSDCGKPEKECSCDHKDEKSHKDHDHKEEKK